MSNKIISSEQLLALSYVEAAANGDEETKALISDEVSPEALIASLTDLSLILAASLVPCHTGSDIETPDEMVEGIAYVLSSVRESFLDHS